jgi:hypothetical protein
MGATPPIRIIHSQDGIWIRIVAVVALAILVLVGARVL